MANTFKNLFADINGLDQKSVDFLTRALAKNNLQGFDYLEYRLSLGNLATMNLDEATTLKSAYATAQTMGVTKNKLVNSARHYEQVLAKEKNQFDAALQGQLSKRVEGKRNEVDKLKKQISIWKEQIDKLNAQIEKSQQTIDNADQHIKAEMDKIQLTKDNFERTFKGILNAIEGDIDKIERHL